MKLCRNVLGNHSPNDVQNSDHYTNDKLTSVILSCCTSKLSMKIKFEADIPVLSVLMWFQ